MLAFDATIADIVDKLREPEEYVRRALGNFHDVLMQEPTAKIKIGVTGNGAYPNYKIDRLTPPPDDDPVRKALFPDGIMRSERVFNGRTHRLLVDPEKVRRENWSLRSMTFNELQTLLGQIRKVKR